MLKIITRCEGYSESVALKLNSSKALLTTVSISTSYVIQHPAWGDWGVMGGRNLCPTAIDLVNEHNTLPPPDTLVAFISAL